jgi:hypothetical protein
MLRQTHSSQFYHSHTGNTAHIIIRILIQGNKNYLFTWRLQYKKHARYFKQF